MPIGTYKDETVEQKKKNLPVKPKDGVMEQQKVQEDKNVAVEKKKPFDSQS